MEIRLVTSPTPAVNEVAVESLRASSPPSAPAVSPAIVQTAEEFLRRELPPKEPLIEGLLYRRDIVAFAGRRRHGKTTFLGSLVTALTIPKSEFLGYAIPKGMRVVAFFLEDDAREIQDKLNSMSGGSFGGRLAVYTRDDFFRDKIPMAVSNRAFRDRVKEICAQHRADLIVIDNLAHLIGADYNNSTKIHEVFSFAWELTRLNPSVIIAAHPRKRSKNKGDIFSSNVTLRSDPEDFFEEVMGSSHFVNSCGSLWGIERNIETNRTDFLGGTQRLNGEQSLMLLEKSEDGSFRLVTDDWEEAHRLALNTTARKKAWELLPLGWFTYTDAEEAVKTAMKSSSTFNTWFNQLRRLGMLLHADDGYRKAAGPGTP